MITMTEKAYEEYKRWRKQEHEKRCPPRKIPEWEKRRIRERKQKRKQSLNNTICQVCGKKHSDCECKIGFALNIKPVSQQPQKKQRKRKSKSKTENPKQIQLQISDATESGNT